MPSSLSSSSSSRSSSPTLTASSDGLYIPVHKRFSASSISSSRTFSSGSSRTFSSGASSTSSESDSTDSAISPPATPTFIYSRDTLLNLANSPLSRMPQPQRDDLRSKVPEVMTNRKQRKTIEHFNHINAVQAAVAQHVPSSRQNPPSNNHRQRHHKERISKPVVV